MVTDLDFEELDDMMGQMADTKDLTESIAADVAKVSPQPKTKKATKKSSQKSVKVSDTKSEPKIKAEILPEPKPVAKKPVIKTEETTNIPEVKPLDPVVVTAPELPKIESPEDLDGTKVAVRVLTKYAEEPEVPVYEPNPKTGKFMDFVNPKGIMDSTQQPITTIPVVTMIEASETVVETIEEETPDELSNDEQDDRDRLEKNGLDPDATVEEMMEQAEPEDGDEFLEELMNNLGDDIEEEAAQPAIDPEAATADILSYPDRTDAFLSELDVEKRPLGGSAVAAAIAMEDNKEAVADKEFIEDKPNDKWLKEEPSFSKKEQKKLKKEAKKQANIQSIAGSKTKKKSQTSQILLYVALILLLAILGGSLGALAYFSGLF